MSSARKWGDILELRNIGRIDIHQGAVGIEAGSAGTYAARLRRCVIQSRETLRGESCPRVMSKEVLIPRFSRRSAMRTLGLRSSMAWLPLPLVRPFSAADSLVYYG
jgi:hypothetical protein